MQYFYRVLKLFLQPLAIEPTIDANVTSDPARLAAIEDRVVAGACCGAAVPICTTYVGGARLCHVRTNYAEHMIENVLPNVGLLTARREDVVVANFGLWHHLREGAYPSLVERWAEYVFRNASSLPRTVIWRDNTPQHFDIANGEFPHPDEAGEKLKNSRGCRPIEGVRLAGVRGASHGLRPGDLVGPNEHVKLGGWRNRISNPIMQAHGIPQLDTWNETLPLYDMHTAKECTHWCAPGAHNIWIYSLWKLMQKLDVRKLPEPNPQLPDPLQHWPDLPVDEAAHRDDRTDRAGTSEGEREGKEATEGDPKHRGDGTYEKEKGGREGIEGTRGEQKAGEKDGADDTEKSSGDAAKGHRDDAENGKTSDAR